MTIVGHPVHKIYIFRLCHKWFCQHNVIYDIPTVRELYWIHRQKAVSFQSPHSDYVTRCYFNLCLQQGSRDDRVSRDVFSFLYL